MVERTSGELLWRECASERGSANNRTHTTLDHTTMHHTTLHHTIQHYITPHHTASHHNTLHDTTVHHTTLHHTILRYTTPHHTNDCSNDDDKCTIASAILKNSIHDADEYLARVSTSLNWKLQQVYLQAVSVQINLECSFSRPYSIALGYTNSTIRKCISCATLRNVMEE